MISMARHSTVAWLIVAGSSIVLGACTHTPPTIAHTHIGHAITGFDGTPGDQGLFEVAESRAENALVHAQAAQQASDLAEMKRQVQLVVQESSSAGYSLQDALAQAVSHIVFAANSDDASANVRARTQGFQEAAKAVNERCDLISLLGNDVLVTRSADEGRVLTAQIGQLAAANVTGAGADSPGVEQLRAMLDAMVDSEQPPYVTVDRWYLFHLVRLPDCDNCWAWRKWANSSNRGY